MNGMDWPNGTSLAFVIRDDDLSFFTEAEALVKLYRNAWEKEYKISFAAIPAIKCVNNLNVPPRHRGTGQVFAIADNSQLIAWLKSKISKKQVDIVQHGLNHTSEMNLPPIEFDLKNGRLVHKRHYGRQPLTKYSEFADLGENEAFARVQYGKKLLEEAVEYPLTVFAPPQGLLTKPLWTALFKCGLACADGVDRIFGQIPLSSLNVARFSKLALRRVLGKCDLSIHLSRISSIVTLQTSYRHYWSKFLSEDIAGKQFKVFQNIFKEKMKAKSYFILLTHHWEYFYDWHDEVTHNIQLRYLNLLLDWVDEQATVWKCTLSELASWLTQS